MGITEPLKRPQKMFRIICFTLFFNLFVNTQAEFYSAQSELESLIESHLKVIEDLQPYINKKGQRLSILIRYFNRYKEEHKKAVEDIPKYLGNPINAYTLIKRLTYDIENVNQIIEFAKDNAINIPPLLLRHKGLSYPTKDDLKGAAHALARLQKIYKLNTHELSEGKLNGVVESSPMTASDCYVLGHELMFNYTNIAEEWLVETLRKYKEENVTNHFTEADIIDHLKLAKYVKGNKKTALELLEIVLGSNSELPTFNDLVQSGVISLEKTKDEQKNADDDGISLNELGMMHIYESLCRNEINIAVDVANRLSCRYFRDNPFLKIAPLKMEMLYLNPDVVLFHEVLSDREIQTLKEISKNRLQRAYVLFGEKNSTINDRISKLAWLNDSESDVVARLTRQTAYMTGLSMETAECLQVLNYGIGGHYEPHYDFIPENTRITLNDGNRIATVMFYMSDVAQGGATVFPWLGLRVNPVKGAAVFWRNLHPSGKGNSLTLHAGCPVLQGSKWVANKWLHQGGQEFFRPRDLKFEGDDQEFIPDHILHVFIRIFKELKDIKERNEQHTFINPNELVVDNISNVHNV